MTALKFKVGDRITVEATVMGVNTPCEWISVEFPNGGYGTIESPDDVATLVERPKTPGQRAYEAWAEGSGHADWASITTEYRKRWERAAGAV